MSESTSSSGGIGVLGLLGVAFVVLKLTHVINWSWWWVTAPFWGGFAIFIGLLVAAGGGFAVVLGILEWRHRRRMKKFRVQNGNAVRSIRKN